MIFVDTNYFLRFLLRDIESQYNEAKNLFLQAGREEVELYSSTVVFFEVFWVLRSTYKKDKQALIDKLNKLLRLNVEFDNHPILVDGVDLFKKLNLTLEDCYNLCLAKEKGFKDFKTFDIKLGNEFEKLAQSRLWRTRQVGKKKTS